MPCRKTDHSLNLVLPLQVLNALHNAKIFPCSIFLDSEQASSVHVLRVNINHEVLQALQLVLCVVVVGKQLFDLVVLGLFERNIVRISAEDVFELAF